MERFQEIIFKLLAATQPNAPLTTNGKALIRDGLNKLVSQYETPDHPPYSAMIERALGELNDKRGSTEDSISKFLKRTYSNLPLAHSAFLKHHLGKLCESGYITTIHGKRYMLNMENQVLDPSTKVKRKQKTRRCRWAFEKQCNKKRKKKRNQKKGRKVEVNEGHLESDEEELQLIEYRTNKEGKQIEQGPRKGLLSCDDPRVLPTEAQCSAAAIGKVQPDEKRSYPQEICPPGTAGVDSCAAHSEEQEELRLAECNMPELLSPDERPPGFKFIRVENLSHTESKATAVLAPGEELYESNLTLRQMRHQSRRFAKPKLATAISRELGNSPELEEFHSQQVECSDFVSPPNQEMIVDLTSTSVETPDNEQQQSGSLEADFVEVLQPKRKGDKMYIRRRKRMLWHSENVTVDTSAKSEHPTELQCEHALEQYPKADSLSMSPLLDKRESQDLIQQLPLLQQEEIPEQKQPSKSLRVRSVRHNIPNEHPTELQCEHTLEQYPRADSLGISPSSNKQESKDLIQQLPLLHQEEIPEKKQLSKSLRVRFIRRDIPNDVDASQPHEDGPRTFYGPQPRLSKQKLIDQEHVHRDESQHRLETEEQPRFQRPRRKLKPVSRYKEYSTFTDDCTEQCQERSRKPHGWTSVTRHGKTEEMLLHSKSKRMKSAETSGDHVPLPVVLALEQPYAHKQGGRRSAGAG